MKTTFRLDGIMVNDGQIIDGIAGEFEGFSDIVPLRATKDGVKATSDGFLLSEEEFAQTAVGYRQADRKAVRTALPTDALRSARKDGQRISVHLL